jgi:SAM-dependent methyltransferase
MTTSAEVVASWNVRGRSYRELARRYPLFDTYARRLVAGATSPGFDGALLDVGGGFGLAAAIALDEHPRARATVAEPAAVMRELAREELAGFGARAVIVDADAARPPDGPFDAAIASAVMHLVDEREALPAIARALAVGARFAFNLWGHSFEDTAIDPDPGPVWRAALDSAIAELGLTPRPPERPAAAPRIRTRAGLDAAVSASGLELVSLDVDEDRPPAAFHVDFAAMAPSFLPRLSPELRARVVARARELGTAPTPVRTARVVVRRVK